MRNLPVYSTGDFLQAGDFNDIPEELENSITSTGQTLSAADLYQLGKAMAIYAAAGDFYTDGGTANTYVLSKISSMQIPIAYRDGMRVRFVPANTNTAASTINVAGLGVKSIKKEDLSALEAGQIVADELVELYYSLSDDVFLISGVLQNATELTSGVAKIATQAETNSGIIDTKIITPKKLKEYVKMRITEFLQMDHDGTTRGALGLSGIRASTGVYNYTFTSPKADINYAVDVNVMSYHRTTGGAHSIASVISCVVLNKTINGFSVQTISSCANDVASDGQVKDHGHLVLILT